MTICIIMITLAFAWLGYETDWMRVRLPVNETLREYDQRILARLKMDWDTRYNQWLKERYEPKLVYGSIATNAIDPRDKWMVIEEDLTARRNGEMIYQRGGNR